MIPRALIPFALGCLARTVALTVLQDPAREPSSVADLSDSDVVGELAPSEAGRPAGNVAGDEKEDEVELINDIAPWLTGNRTADWDLGDVPSTVDDEGAIASDGPDHLSASASCKNVALLRIQKTASTTLGGKIMPRMCIRGNQTCVRKYHIEYREAIRRVPNCVITMLRDPVERFVSEFMMARSPGLTLMLQDQWDFHHRDLQWLRGVNWMANESEARLAYLRSPNNPSRNRQALYLLGFNRVRCRGRCCGKCAKDEPSGYPAHEYNWDRDHDALLAQAKKNLLSLRAFGVVDCFVDSAKLIANVVGWNEKEVEEMASTIHRNNQKTAANLRRFEPNYRRQALFHADSSSRLWAHVVPSALQEEIRAVNRLDDELVAFAKRHLYEEHHIECGRPS